MRRRVRRQGALVGTLLLLLLTVAPVTHADGERLQTVYDLTVANGIGYTEVFYPASETTLYLLAGQPVAISPRRTMVYYWATSGEWQADWAALNEPVGVTLDVHGPHTVMHVQRAGWVLSYQQTPSAVTDDSPAELYVGQRATQAYRAYLAASNDYAAAMDHYNAAMATYKLAVGRFLDAVGRLLRQAMALEAEARHLKAAGQPGADALLKRVRRNRVAARRLPIPRQPRVPAMPQLYVTAPRQDFVVTLPAGRYDVVARDAHGHIIAGTRRHVVAFAPRRSGIGYTVIPEVKWTSPSTLDDPADALYVAQRATYYIQPFREAEYNEYDYTKLTDPQNDNGRPSAWTWVRTGLMTTGTLRLSRPSGASLRAHWRPYYVEQLPGSALGYTIVPFTSALFPGEGPSFWAYRLVVPAVRGRLVLERGSESIPGATRLIYPVDDPGASAFAPALLPLLAGFALALRHEQRRTGHRAAV